MGNPISTGESIIAIGQGSTWSTAVNCTSKLHGLVTLNTSLGEFRSRDVGFSNKLSEIVKLEESVEVVLSCDVSYHSPILHALAGVLGDCATPAEQTGSQGDYLHDIDLADSATDFFTLAWLSAEDDAVIELPSVKFYKAAYQQNTNEVGKITLTGIADRVVDQALTPQNTVAEIEALSYPTFQEAVLGGANHYFRIDQVANAPLGSGDDQEILAFGFEVNRPLEREFVLRGANTKYTDEPKQLGMTDGKVMVQFAKSERSSHDWLAYRRAETKLLAEFFIDGDLIGSTINTSYKFQFPKLELVGNMPGGFDLPNNNSRMRPDITMNMLKASSAPSGMTGVTDYLRVVAITEESSKYAA